MLQALEGTCIVKPIHREKVGSIYVPDTGKAPAKSPHKHLVDATRYIHINKYFKGSADED
jgi:hypothetical protein